MTDVIGFSNRGRVAINMGGGLALGGTTLTITPSGVLPASGAFDVQIEGEYVHVPASANTGGTTFVGVQRGQFGTSAAAHINGTAVVEVITAAELAQFVQVIHQQLALDSDVAIVTPLNNDLLTYETSSGLWKNKPAVVGSTTLAADTDVSLSSILNNDILTYETSSGKWKNKPYPPSSATLSGDTDVSLTSLSDGDVLTYDIATSKWKNKPDTDTDTDSLATLTDVALSSPANNDVLTFDTASGKWKNVPDTDTGGGGGATISKSALGSEPGSPSSGDLDLTTDSDIVERYNGSSWDQWGPLLPMTRPPVVSAWTWTNQGIATATDDHGMIFFTSGKDGADNFRFLYRALGSTPWTVTAHMVIRSVGLTHNSNTGLILSDGTKLTSFGVNPTSTDADMAIYQWNTTTSYNSDLIGQVKYGVGPPNNFLLNIWLRIADDGSTRTYSCSQDGIHYVTVGSEAHVGFLTPTRIGFGSSNWDAGLTENISLLSWSGA